VVVVLVIVVVVLAVVVVVIVLVEAYTHTFEQGTSAGLRPLWLVKSQIVDRVLT